MNLILQAIKSAINGVYAYVNKNRLAWTDESTTVLIEKQTLNISEDFFQLDGKFYLKVGQTYIVTCNGTEYECVARYWEDEDCVLLGNGTIYGDGNAANNEPFAIDNYDDGNTYFNVLEPGEYTVSVTENVRVIHKIDKKYLPDFATTEQVENAQATADNAQTTADNAQPKDMLVNFTIVSADLITADRTLTEIVDAYQNGVRVRGGFNSRYNFEIEDAYNSGVTFITNMSQNLRVQRIHMEPDNKCSLSTDCPSYLLIKNNGIEYSITVDENGELNVRAN